MFDTLHIDNHNIPLCGAAGFDRDMVVAEATFTENPYGDRRCWECASIAGVDTTTEDAD